MLSESCCHLWMRCSTCWSPWQRANSDRKQKLQMLRSSPRKRTLASPPLERRCFVVFLRGCHHACNSGRRAAAVELSCGHDLQVRGSCVQRKPAPPQKRAWTTQSFLCTSRELTETVQSEKPSWLAGIGLHTSLRQCAAWCVGSRVSVQGASVTATTKEDTAEAVSSDAANLLGGSFVTERVFRSYTGRATNIPALLGWLAATSLDQSLPLWGARQSLP